MKVLLAPSLFSPHVGGIETFTSEYALLLQKQGHEVVILTKRWPAELSEVDQYEGIDVQRIPSLKTLNEYLEFLPRLRELAPRIKADVVHVIGARRCLPVVGLLLSRWWQVPLVVTIAGTEVPEPGDSISRSVWDENAEFMTDVLMMADGVTVFSKALDKNLREVVPAIGAKLLYAGLNLDTFYESSPLIRQRTYITSVRRLMREKGVDLLVQAFGTLKDEFPQLDLLIAGDGPERENLIMQAKALGVSDRVIFLGTVDTAHMTSLLRGALFTVVPSRCEGGGYINVIAQASSCPVIASNVGGIPEYVESGVSGLLFEAENVSALTIRMRELLTSESMRESLIQAGRNFARSFSWEILFPQYTAYYEELIRMPRRGGTPASQLIRQLI